MNPSLTAIALAGLIGSALLVLMLGRPRTALASGVIVILLAATKFRSRDANALLQGGFDAQIYYEIGLYALVFLIAIRGLLLVPRSCFRLGRSGAVLAAYVGMVLLSAFWSVNLDLTFVRAAQLFALLAYTFVAVSVLGARRLLWITAVSVTVYVVVFAGLAYVFPFANGTKTANGIPRFSWFAVHPIGAGVFAGTAALFLLARTLFPPDGHGRGATRLARWLLAAAFVWIMFATKSRGPIFAFVFSAGLLLIRKYAVGAKTLLTRERALVGLLAVALALLIPVVTGKRGYTVLQFILRGQTPEAFLGMSGRMSLWKVAGQSLLEHPVLGQGYVAARQVLLEEVNWGGHTHNALLESLFGVGIVGAALLWIPFLAVLGASLVRMFRMQPASVGSCAMLASGMVFLLVNSVTGDGIASVASYEPMLLFLFVLSHEAMAEGRPVAANEPPASPDLQIHGLQAAAPAGP